MSIEPPSSPRHRPSGHSSDRHHGQESWRSQVRAEKARNTIYFLLAMGALAVAGTFAWRHYQRFEAPRATSLPAAPAAETATPQVTPRLDLDRRGTTEAMLADLLNLPDTTPSPNDGGPLSATTLKQAAHQVVLGEKALAERRIDAALEHFGKALALVPGLRDVQRLIGTVYLEQGKFTEARSALEAALAEKPASTDIVCGILNNLGHVELALKRTTEAETRFREALQINKAYVRAQFNLATLLRDQGKADEAVALFTQVLHATDTDLDARSRRTARESAAALLTGLRRWPEAAEHFAELVRARPDEALYHFQLGQALAQAGKTTEAIAALRKGVKLVDGARARRWIDELQFAPLQELREFKDLLSSLPATPSPSPR